MRQIAFFLGAALLVACVEKGPTVEVDQAFVKQNLLSAEPAPRRAVGADIGGKIVYLGADIDKESLKPGERFTIVHYWKVVSPLGPDWRVFTHIDGEVQKDWMNVDGTKMRSHYPPDKWKAGDIIRDEQVVSIKPDWSSSFAAVHVGLYHKGGFSEKDRLPINSGPSDGKSRLVVAKIPVANPASSKGAPTPYVIRKAPAPIVVDGKADEPAWSKATVAGPFKDAQGGKPVGGETSARLLWDEKYLYAFIEVGDTDVFSSYTKNDDSIWKELSLIHI